MLKALMSKLRDNTAVRDSIQLDHHILLLGLVEATGTGMKAVLFLYGADGDWLLLAERLFCFLDPYADPQGACYQLVQALNAVGSGGWFGRGLTVGGEGQRLLEGHGAGREAILQALQSVRGGQRVTSPNPEGTYAAL